jgi:S-adenosylmethionine hydrolase
MLKDNVILFINDFGTGSFYSAFLEFQARKSGCVLVELYSNASSEHPYEVAYFVENTIEFGGGGVFVIVVDPGVGSSTRRILAVEYSGSVIFLPEGPILKYLDSDGVGKVWRVREEKFAVRGGHTFHGRDIFLPAAIEYLSGRADYFLTEVSDLRFGKRLYSLEPSDGVVEAYVVHVDNFGNVITNVKRDFLTFENFEVVVGFSRLERIYTCYTEGPDGEPLLLWNSWGYLEIAVKNGSAAEYFDIKRGDRLYVFER